MILRKLILQGFKSFADRTEFDFDRGITGIVGPNGCGKSNIVDAIKWVLGSQSAKSLRGSQMLDVIFNGSGTRKSSGMAQVDLVFENADRRLPIDQTEVTVTRRLYRSGESEYLINKQVCRLKDVRELFLDTGIGVDAYSVIEQGRVDSLLRANPLDRRTIFEEAAGISKYKVRKREAQRRLERVNQNLLRLQDIIEELERRLRSIKLQAGKARNYQAYSQRLKELRSTFALAEYHRLTQSHTELTRVISELSDASTQLRTALSEHEAAISRANIDVIEVERTISDVEAGLMTVQTQITAHQERVATSGQRIEEQIALMDRCHARLVGLEQQVSDLAGKLERQTAEGERIEAGLTEANAEIAKLQGEDHRLVTELNASAARLEDEKAGIMELLRRTAQINNELQGLMIQQENFAGQRTRLEARDVEVAAQMTDLHQRRATLEARQADLDRLLADQNAALDDARAKSAAVAAHRTQLLDQMASAKERRSALESRRQVLDELDRKREGLLAGVREVLEQRDADSTGARFGYVRGAVGELIETDVANALVVEAALGEHEQYLVVPTRENLLTDQEALTSIGSRVLAYCLDQVPPLLGGPDLASQEGVVAPLMDWVRYPGECERLVRHLLGRTYVVATSADAQRLCDLFPGQARFVTRDGAVFEVDGRVALGALGRGAGIVSRRSELRELGTQLDVVAGEIAELGQSLGATESEAGHLEHVQQELRAAVFQANTQRVEVQATLSSLGEALRKLSVEQPLIAQQVAALAQQIGDAQRRSDEGRGTLSQLQSEHAETERIIAQLQTSLEGLRAQRQQLGELMTQARVRAGQLVQQRHAVADAVHQIRATLSTLESERNGAEQDVTNARARIEQLQRATAEAQASLEELSQQREVLSAEAAKQRERREALRRDIDERNAELRRLRAELEQVEGRLHAQEVQSHEVRVRLDDLTARVREELGVDLAEQYAGYTPTEQDLVAVEAEITELREKIERLGNVNLDAISEQEEHEKRHGFLVAQRDDLRLSEKQLTELITKLNAESEQRFMRTFSEVREHFSALFKKLFGGGKAEIFLENTSDVLETGIEIMARPPGKELQTMTLLSGGEKTMTAIALLLAVFKTHPSPFALLDEVDAALDEANNSRFNHVIREFVENTQFLVITHSKRTMSIADVLYGITMQEAGVSRRISVKFENEGAQSQVA